MERLHDAMARQEKFNSCFDFNIPVFGNVQPFCWHLSRFTCNPSHVCYDDSTKHICVKQGSKGVIFEESIVEPTWGSNEDPGCPQATDPVM